MVAFRWVCGQALPGPMGAEKGGRGEGFQPRLRAGCRPLRVEEETAEVEAGAKR